MFPLRIIALLYGVIFLLEKQHYALYNKTKTKLMGLWGYGIISLVWSISLSKGIQGEIIYLTSIFTVFLVLYLVKDVSDVILICRITTLVALLIGVMGVYESVTGKAFLVTKERYELWWVTNYFGWKYPHVLFYNTNDFATFMVAIMPILCIAVEKLRHKMLLRYAGVLFCSFCVFLTDSRLGIILCAVFFLWILPKKNFSGIIGGSVVLAVILLLIRRYWFFLSGGFNDIASISLGEERRIPIWGNAIRNTIRTWGFGVGVGNSAIANEKFCYYFTGGIFEVHNYFLEVLEDFGLFGLGCIVSWCFMIFKRLWPFRKEEKAKFFFSFMVLYCFLTTCSSSLRQSYYLWLFLGLVISYIKLCDQNNEKGYNYGESLS